MDKISLHSQPVHGLSIGKTLAAGDVNGVQHLTRYWWAQGQIKAYFDDAKQLVQICDLGCGCGYGSVIMASIEHARVIGVDFDQRALNPARSKYGNRPNVDFIEMSLEPLDADAIDWPAIKPGQNVFVAFEIFEALRHRELFLANVVDRLAPDGMLLLNAAHHGRKLTTVNNADAWVHYNRDDLEQLLLRFFNSVEFTEDKDGQTRLDNINSHIVQKRPEGVELFEAGMDLIRCEHPIKSRKE